jgi:hypothetical protein
MGLICISIMARVVKHLKKQIFKNMFLSVSLKILKSCKVDKINDNTHTNTEKAHLS